MSDLTDKVQGTTEIQSTTGIATGSAKDHGLKRALFTAEVAHDTAGAVSATIVLEASRTGLADSWENKGTFTLAGNDLVADSLQLDAAYRYVRTDTTAISANSTVTVTRTP